MLPDSDAAICHDHVNRTVCHVRIRLCADNRTDAAGDVVVAGRDVGRERAERLEWGAHAPSRALVSAPADHTSVTDTDRRGRQSEHARRVCSPVFLDQGHDTWPDGPCGSHFNSTWAKCFNSTRGKHFRECPCGSHLGKISFPLCSRQRFKIRGSQNLHLPNGDLIEPLEPFDLRQTQRQYSGGRMCRHTGLISR